MSLLQNWRNLYRERRVIWFVAFTAIMVTVGLIWGFSARAIADQPQTAPRLCQHNPDGTCKWAPPKMARKFRAGYFQHAHGMKPHTFTKPIVAHAIIVRKAVRVFKNLPRAHKRQIRRHIQSQARTLQTRSGACAPPNQNTAKCIMTMSVQEVTQKGSCYGYGYFNTHKRTCNHGVPQPITKHGLIVGGTVFFCGGSLIVTVATAAPTLGSSVLLMAGWGFSACAFSGWAASEG